MNSGTTIGVILIVAGFLICGVVSLLMGTGIASGQLQPSGGVLGIGLFGILPLIVLAGGGGFLFVKGRAEGRELASVRKKEKLLGLIQAQGKVALGAAMIEMKMTREEITADIYDLVNQGLFSGYIDWENATFFSAEASKVGSDTCPNCGGRREIAGKGVVKCPYCGVELFIPN